MSDYTPTGNPTTDADGVSADMRAEFDLIQTAIATKYDAVSDLTGTASGLTSGNVTTNANLTGHITSVGNAAVLGSFTVAQLNTAISDADVATGGGTATNTNTGDQTLSSLGAQASMTAASQAEMEAGTETALRSMTPQRVKQAITALATAGFAAASQSQAEAGTADTVAITPLSANWHPGVAKCWIKCDYAGAIQASHNVTSITDTGTGNTTITIGTDFSSIEYSVTASNIFNGASLATVSSQAAGSLVVKSYQFTYTNPPAKETDATNLYVACFGDQA